MVVAQFYAHHPVLLYEHVHNFVIHKSFGAMQLGVEHIGHCQAERIDRCVGNLNCSYEIMIHCGFHYFGKLRVNNLGTDASLGAFLHKCGLEIKVILG